MKLLRRLSLFFFSSMSILFVTSVAYAETLAELLREKQFNEVEVSYVRRQGGDPVQRVLPSYYFSRIRSDGFLAQASVRKDPSWSSFGKIDLSGFNPTAVESFLKLLAASTDNESWFSINADEIVPLPLSSDLGLLLKEFADLSNVLQWTLKLNITFKLHPEGTWLAQGAAPLAGLLSKKGYVVSTVCIESTPTSREPRCLLTRNFGSVPSNFQEDSNVLHFLLGTIAFAPAIGSMDINYALRLETTDSEWVDCGRITARDSLFGPSVLSDLSAMVANFANAQGELQAEFDSAHFESVGDTYRVCPEKVKATAVYNLKFPDLSDRT